MEARQDGEVQQLFRMAILRVSPVGYNFLTIPNRNQETCNSK